MLLSFKKKKTNKSDLSNNIYYVGIWRTIPSTWIQFKHSYNKGSKYM